MSRIQRVVLAAAAVAYAAVGTGCIAMGSAQKADTLGKGHLQFGVEPGAFGFVLPPNAATTSNFLVLPDFNASFRYGLTDTADIGVRAGTSMLELGTKLLLTDPSNDFIAISLAPSVNGAYIGLGGNGATMGFGTANVQIPALVGFKFGQGSEFVLGPRVNNAFFFGNSNTGSSGGSGVVYEMSLGASIGVAFQLTDFFALMPEFSALVPVVTTFSSQSGNTSTSGTGPGLGPRFGFHLNFLLGRGRTAETPSADLPPPPPPPPAPLPPPPAAP
ncbi:MAG: hypothetical protein K1X64_15240 [Myxococcaceae bacterium]|nr:hypothetical protein [Myxococcaceae bacterium]